MNAGEMTAGASGTAAGASAGMTAEQLYERIGGSYEEALGRMGSDRLISRFIVMFTKDESCGDVVSSWNAGDETAAFNAAHTAKGVCGNLSLTKLAELTSTITEALRPGNDKLRATTDVDALVNELARMHGETVTAIAEFEQAQ